MTYQQNVHAKNKGVYGKKLFITIATMLLTFCMALHPHVVNASSLSFSDYQKNVQAQLRQNRQFQSADKEAEVIWNSPQEWQPKVPPVDGIKKGILLVHGLGDSPFSFTDVAQKLADEGFLVRTVLLPGHGTRPEDLLDVKLEDWRKILETQAQTLKNDVDEVYLGGFSTGANLVIEYAYAHPEVAGLMLFSPGFRSDSWFDFLAPVLAWFKPWILSPESGRPLQNNVRYLTAPTNGFAQYYYSSKAAQKVLKRKPYNKPVFMVVTQHDSVLDTGYLLDIFQRRFTHPKSRLIWYGNAPEGLTDTARVFVKTDYLPAFKISQFSHMGMLFSPENKIYGVEGSLRFCWNGQTTEATEQCKNGAPIWYSAWGYREEGKVHARLTFNPYFQWQSSIMQGVFED